MADIVVVGVGNRDRGDDAAGPEVVARLEETVPPGVRLATTVGSDPASLMDLWEGARLAVVVDAVVSGAEAGTVLRVEAATPLPANIRLVSTHALGAGTAIELARAVGRIPERLVVIGIEGSSYRVGTGLSPRVAEAVPVAAGMVLEEVVATAGGRRGEA